MFLSVVASNVVRTQEDHTTTTSQLVLTYHVRRPSIRIYTEN